MSTATQLSTDRPSLPARRRVKAHRGPMTTSLPHTHIRLRDLSELVAGIPYIIGFPPTNSLVLFTFRRCPDLVLSTTVRVDLPKPEHVSLVAAEVSNAVARNEVAAAIAVVVGDSGAEHRELIDMLRKALDAKGILLSHASWVSEVAHGEQWQCYQDPLCTDVVPDPQSSALAAATAVAGDTTYPNRDAMAAQLASDPEEALERRKNLLALYRPTPVRPYTDEDARDDLTLLGQALDKTLSTYDLPHLTDHQLVRLALALTQKPVKDECMAIVFSEEAKFAERLWTVLVRALPMPERAEPAFLLAISAYLRGSGVLAGLALKIVMESDPLHGMAVLLDFALQKGVSPNNLRTLLMTSILNNNEEQADSISLDDDPPWDTTPERPCTSTTSGLACPEPPKEDAERAAQEPGCGTQPGHDTSGEERTIKLDLSLSTGSGRVEPMPKNSTICEPASKSMSPSAGPTPSGGVVDRSTPAPDRSPIVVASPAPAEPEGDSFTKLAHGLVSPAVPGELPVDEGVVDRPRQVVRPSNTPSRVTEVAEVAANGERKSFSRGWFVGSPAMFSPSPCLASDAVDTGESVCLERPVDSTASAVLPSTGEPAGMCATRSMGVEPLRIAPGPLSQRVAEALSIHGDVPVRATVTMDALTAFLPPPTDLPTERSEPV